jgi:hypothetical protein
MKQLEPEKPENITRSHLRFIYGKSNKAQTGFPRHIASKRQKSDLFKNYTLHLMNLK